MIDIVTARKLIDFNASNIGMARAEEQLAGAVAMHNILERYNVAYLADEVGMGKTYVALGAMALFRHFEPEFRVLVIAPRENIQRKWMKELGNFAKNNFRFPDLRVKSLRGGPAKPIVMCGNLHDIVHQVSVDSRRDFFLRMSSFSFGLGKDREGWKTQRDNLRRELPWLADEVFDLRSKEAFKDNYARAVCCALPEFDLVIVDEGHNLKHGFRTGVAARNRVMALAFGRSMDQIDTRIFPGYGRRARRVLFLSATPIEGSYEQLWNQLDVFGLGGPFSNLKERDAPDEEKRRTAAQFLVRRVTTATVNGQELTKNQYRREWRQGGVFQHDQPIFVDDPKKRLVVALVQKKVAELLGSGRFTMSFQIGMLASFESFLQTAKVRNDDEDMIFDDAEQQRDLSDLEKDGLDVRDINRLARDFFNTFHYHMPHPKMDAVVESLATSWLTGRKTLVFVRRVASVTELEQKLNECYDKWLIPYLLHHLPEAVKDRFRRVVDDYRREKQTAQELRRSKLADTSRERGAEDDHGGTDTFFAWFFRGDGPKGVVSGANVQRRFIQSGSAYSTFFDRNHLAELLGAEAGGVAKALASAVGLSVSQVAVEVRDRAAKYLSAKAKVHPSHDRFVAAQAGAIKLLSERGGSLVEPARLVFQQVYQGTEKKPHSLQAPEVVEWLEEQTFFTEILRPDWSELRGVLWPASRIDKPAARFVEEEMRARLLSTVARLGHGLIDIYLLTIKRLGSLELRTLESDAGGGQSRDERRITEYLSTLEKQRTTPLSERAWGAFDELRELARNFDLILDVNAPEARDMAVADTARLFGTLLGRQQPVGGMWGQVSRTLVQQFRMPGYPFVLVTTDLLQEGEDLHTFCSSIYHYGISWTASSMEQRIGRIDRVRSQTDRLLSGLDRDPHGEDLLQVHFPHLQDTVEILQVEKVLERMNVFLRLMHEGLVVASAEDKHIDVASAVARGRQPVETIREKLRTAFPIRPSALAGDVGAVTVPPALADEALDRLAALQYLSGGQGIEWTPSNIEGQLFGTMKLPGSRIQPFTLFLDSLAGRLLIKCISPVGVVDLVASLEAIKDSARMRPVRIGAVLGPEAGSYNLTVQEAVLLADRAHDEARVDELLRRVAEQADRLEQIHLPDADRALDVFIDDLGKEGAG